MKQKLPLSQLITDKKLAMIRKQYNKPLMTKAEAYKKVIAISNYVDVLKSFSFKN